MKNSMEMSGNQAGKADLSQIAPIYVPAIAETIPRDLLETIFSYVDVKDLLSCAQVCTSWARVLEDENSEVWRERCERKLPIQFWRSDLLKNVPTYKQKLRAYHHAWNPEDCSNHIQIKKNAFTFIRMPAFRSSDGVRGKIGYAHGRHAWEVVWEGQLGRRAMVGVATKDAALNRSGYIALVGNDAHGWGWNVATEQLVHAAKVVRRYPTFPTTPQVECGDRIRIILDCEEHLLTFEKNEMFMGIAFKDLPDEKLYPAASTEYGNSEASLVYLGQPVDG